MTITRFPVDDFWGLGSAAITRVAGVLAMTLSHTPPELVMAHLNIDRAVYDAISKDKAVFVPE